MVANLDTETRSTIVYPDSDGQPMADNTLQFRWITEIYYNLAWLFADRADVFVAGDLLWYPVEGNNKLRQAPDVTIAFGVPKGDRGSYQQWKENNIAPQVVFEILSPENRLAEMNRKQVFYDRYGVEEYYIYDPDKNDLSGWLRSKSRLDVIDNMDGWVSPRLGIRFQLGTDTLLLYRPDGTLFTSYLDIQRRLNEKERDLEETQKNLEQTQQDLERERQKAAQLAERLRAAGIDPDRL